MKKILLMALLATFVLPGMALAQDATSSAQVNGVQAVTGPSSANVGDVMSGSTSSIGSVNPMATGGNATGGAAAAAAAAGDNNAQIDSNNVYNNKSTVYNRQFLQPGNTPFPQTNGFFTTPTPDSSFRSVTELLNGDGITIRLSKDALKALAAWGKSNTHMQIIKSQKVLPRGGDVEDGVQYLTITYHKPIVEMVNGKQVLKGVERPAGLTLTGYIDGEATNAKTNSFQVLGMAGLKALADKNTHMVITTEGAHRKVEAKGFGIGFYGVYGANGDGGKQAGAGGGGTGFAWNETGPEDRPWIQGYVAVTN